jgi:magnesium-protoporphyrin O-methyltransferase
MPTTAFAERRGALEAYFDRTALDSWKQLTSNAPVSKIRATVRAGRDRMRTLLLDWLPSELSGARVLDAGCGTGALSFEVARRGADVVAVDVSSNLVEIARDRMPAELGTGTIDFRCGDMLDPMHGEIDFVVAMDSLIHYETRDTVAALARFARRTSSAILVTIAPRTAALAVMHSVGRIFPRGNRAPAIVPADITILCHKIACERELADWRVARTERVMNGFYTSQAIELVRK